MATPIHGDIRTIDDDIAENDLRRLYGQNVRLRRNELGYSQERLAAQVGVCGVTIYRIEKGINMPSPLVQRRIARSLLCRYVEDLFRQPELPPPPPII